MSTKSSLLTLAFTLGVVIMSSNAEAVRVTTAAELEAEVAAGTQEIVLTPGQYKITDTLKFPNALRLLGETSNPRDTVIYGDGTFRIIDLRANKIVGGYIANLTVSNGCALASDNNSSTAGVLGYANANPFSTLTNVVVTCNTVLANGNNTGSGAGVSFCILRDCQITRNRLETAEKKGNGGGVHLCYCYDTEISYNEAPNTYGGGGNGSGFYCRCRIFNNLARQGGGVNGNSNYSVYDHTVVSNNIALVRAGGCMGAARVSDSDIVFNKVSGGSDFTGTEVSGGGLYDCALVSNCVIRGNAVVGTAKQRYGGAAVSSKLVDCPLVCDNYVENGYASALMACTAINCFLTNNVATGNNRCSLRKVTAERCTFYGGTVDSSGSTAQISSFTACQFLGHSNADDAYVLPVGANVAASGSFPGFAGLVNLGGSVSGFGLYMTNCLIARNKLPASWIVQKSKPEYVAEFVNCTFSDNDCMYTVRGLNNSVDLSQNVKFVNTIFYRNYFNSPARSSFTTDNGAGMTFDHCLFDLPKTVPNGNVQIESLDLPVNADIRFDTANAEHPYSLQRKSPAIGKGLWLDWMASATDLKGDARAHGTSVAIGCYECWIPAPGLILLLR